MPETLTWMFDAEKAEQFACEGVRITCGPVDVRGLVAVAQRAAEVETAARALCGVADGAALPASVEEVYNLLQMWARASVATVRVESFRKGEWGPSSLTTLGWDTAEGVLDVPAPLLAVWQRVAMACNPGLWGPAVADPAKKTGLIQVT